MTKIVLTGHINVAAGQIDLIKSALPKHIALTLQEPGCLAFRVTQREHQPSIFEVYEEFVDKQAFEAHQKRVSSSSWGVISKDVERHYVVKDIVKEI
ncbi:putative quinol monooxygenase [Paraglaciecola arctica]|uniref:putative quinol monooxygenase n=1 Tax=Paraglaciecola arctica TaxID=1128911 RepID=UPI001C074C79|nr:antibiotic biosynthesis monooxygenase [Paraglaciecola arctica]MBU3006160.1 antibiotic biosynthesis monooxygenase [Paraglaciecola arctica]